MKRILITGITGFVGSNLARYFSDQDAFAIFGYSRNPIQAKVKLPESHVQMIETYSKKILDELKIDVVIHLAGIAHDLSNQYTAEDYDRVNFENTKTIFDEFVTSGAQKFIFLSSIKAAIDSSSVPVDETVAPSPVTDYGRSKRRAEEYIQSIVLKEGKKVYIFRPCMIHGQGNKGNLNLLYKYARTGLPFPFGSFQNKRSFLSMDNLSFITQAFMEKDIPSGIFHLADDGPVSTTELFHLISLELNNRSKIWNLPVTAIRVLFSIIGKRQMLNKLTEDLIVSNQKLMKCMDTPLPYSLRDGLRKTIRSFHVV